MQQNSTTGPCIAILKKGSAQRNAAGTHGNT